MRYIGEKWDTWETMHAQAGGTAPLRQGENKKAERLVAIAEAEVRGSEQVAIHRNLANRWLISNPPTDSY